MLATWLCGWTIQAQNTEIQPQISYMVDSVRIYYKPGYRYVDLEYKNNRKELEHFLSSIRSAESRDSIEQIVIEGGTSPDGTNTANERLSRLRTDSLASYILQHSPVSEALIEKRAEGIAWGRLHSLVQASDMPYKEDVLHLLDNTPLWIFDADGKVVSGRKKELMELHGGRPYRYMLQHLFPELRSSIAAKLYLRQEKEVAVLSHSTETSPSEDKAVLEQQPEVDSPTQTPSASVQEEIVTSPDNDGWMPQIHVKTNAVGWGMMILNAAVEIDLSRWLSVNLPFYYSGLNYFSSQNKFRILATQPEVRIWPLKKRSFFAGVHFGVASYNLALGSGKWRIQDHNGTTPAIGGGINIGYRMPFCKNKRFNLEFSLGAGAYKAHYDKFHNEKGGSYDSTVKETFWSIDNIAVSFSYAFDLKKGGKK